MPQVRRLQFAVALLAFALPVIGQDTPDISRIPREVLDAITAAAEPGDPHKTLESFVGSWDVLTLTWTSPDEPPVESTGTSENTWVLGHRFVQQRFEGTYLGVPFEGIGYTGYDNTAKAYIGSWMDTMGTSITLSSGKPGGASTLTFESRIENPLGGGAIRMTQSITVRDRDHHRCEIWIPGPDGKPFRSMELQYTRRD